MDKITVDTRNGYEVAKALFVYLNGSRNQSEFHIVLARYPKPAHNFIVLAYQWLYRLNQVTYWDGRNESSILMARQIVQAMGLDQTYNFAGQLQHTKQNQDPIMEIDRADTSQIAFMLSCYLNHNNAENGIYSSFLNYAISEHKTLQQCFTRLCRNWCRFVVEQEPLGKGSKSVQLAKTLAEDQSSLPFI